MRRVFPLLLMLLLVLRGLMGTAMAVGMVPALTAGGMAQQTSLVQPPLHSPHAIGSAISLESGFAATTGHSTGAPHDGMHAQCAHHATGPCASAAQPHSPLCSACEICHSALLAPPRLSALPLPGAAETRPATTALFASAAAALAIKPPIS